MQGLPAALASPIFGEFRDNFNGEGRLDSVVCKHILRLASMLSASYKSTKTAEALKVLQEEFGKDYKGVFRGNNFSHSTNLGELLTKLLRDQLGGLRAITLAYVMRVGQPQPEVLSERLCEGMPCWSAER